MSAARRVRRNAACTSEEAVSNRSCGSGSSGKYQPGHRFGHGLDVGIHPGLKMSHHPSISLQQPHPVVTGQPIPIDRGQDHRQQQTRWNRLQISRQPMVVIPLRIEKIEIRRQNLSIEHTFETTTYPRQIPYPRRPIRGISSMPLRPPRPPATRRSPRPNNPTPPAPHRCPPPASVARDAPRKVFPTSRWASPEC